MRKKRGPERNEVVSEVCALVSQATCQLRTPVRTWGNVLAIMYRCALRRATTVAASTQPLHSTEVQCLHKQGRYIYERLDG